jgi:hypothetical protein
MRKTLFIKILEEFGIPNKWSRLNSEFTMEPRSEFSKKIIAYYSGLGLEPSNEIILEVSDIITEDLYKSYQHSWEKYPKSRKRYSILKMEDLNHPHIFRLIMQYLKENHSNEYSKYSCTLLGITNKELQEEEKRQYQFFNK